MNLCKINSYAKINVSLGVLGRLKSKLHKIESLVSLINLHDDIHIKKINSKSHKIKFFGKFSNNIPKNNTVTNLLKILDNNKKLKNQKYLIKINKKIPQKSGMGGGSMNAAFIIKYLINYKKLNLNSKEIFNIASKIGSDVILGLQNKSFIDYKSTKFIKINKNLKFFVILAKPSFGCSTKKIYKGVKSFSKPILKKNKLNKLNYKFISNLKNDLEAPAFRKYSALENLKIFMEKLENVLFVRMTGSGSTMVGYFNSKKAAVNAGKILKKKYKNYWCIASKTI